MIIWASSPGCWHLNVNLQLSFSAMSCAPNSNPILIAGAGPTGLVLAISLLKQGVPVRLIDKESTYRVGYKGSGIMPRSLELYYLLGFLPTVLALGTGQTIRKTYLPNGESTTKELIDLVENTPDRPFVHRQEAALRDHLEKTFGFSVELGTELVSFEQHDNGVKARLIKKTPDGEQVEDIFDTPYLVGADGAHSVVRKLLGLSFLGGEKFEVTMVVGDIWVKGLDNGYWHTWGDRINGMITMRAFETHDGRFNFMVAGKDVDTALAGSSREGFIQTFEKITGRTDIEFGDLIWLSVYTPRVRMANKFSEGRVFVAGDACHIHSPIGGQGLNTSIQDAFNLGWKLGLVHKGLAPPRLLDSYSFERVPVVAAMLDKTTELTKSAFALKPGTVGDAVKRPFEFRQSPILVDDFAVEGAPVDPYRSGDDGMALAGDRAPDAPGLRNGDTETSLFKLFGSTFHTVLVFGKPSVAGLDGYPKDIIEVLPLAPQGSSESGDIYVDSLGYAYRHYDVVARGIQFVVVRPDGVIGALTKSEEGLLKYFKELLL
ncbi:hypothetical protein BDZ89DRAFT_1103732 [Hymenopellis radicata]|nr:hypothetical protein BDZ89DRAFT_1103732 [Hymenopellis radicata]